MSLKDFGTGLLEKFTEHLNKTENKSWIHQQILNPVATYIEGYLKPYFLLLMLSFIAMIILQLYNIRLSTRLLQLHKLE